MSGEDFAAFVATHLANEMGPARPSLGACLCSARFPVGGYESVRSRGKTSQPCGSAACACREETPEGGSGRIERRRPRTPRREGAGWQGRGPAVLREGRSAALRSAPAEA